MLGYSLLFVLCREKATDFVLHMCIICCNVYFQIAALSILIMFVFVFEVPNLSSKFKAIQTIIKLLIIYGSAPYIIDCI